jgi:tetratricopeptide (TPR) repeat protein
VANVVYIVADNHYLNSRLGATYQEQLAGAETAVRLNPYNDMYRAQVGVVHADAFRTLLQQADSLEESGQDRGPALEQARTMFEMAVRSLEETIEFVPLEYDNYLFITNTYNLAGQVLDAAYFQDAMEWARKGIQVSEFGPGIRFQHAIALRGSGNTEAAKRELLAATEMDPRFADPWVLLGEILLDEGDTATALEKLERAIELKPDYPGLSEMIQSATPTAGAGSE